MSLAYKLYRLGRIVDDAQIEKIYKTDIEKYKEAPTLIVDFRVRDGELEGEPALVENRSLDDVEHFFAKKIGGTSDSYYLYPNFLIHNKINKKGESELLKKFKNAKYTFGESLMRFASDEHKKQIEPILQWLEAYDEDTLGLSQKDPGDYFLVFTLNGKSFVELMPEVKENFFNNEFVKPHIEKKGKPLLYEAIDAMTGERCECGYNPDVKFFTYDNYHDALKPDIINKLRKESATYIKKGWLFAVEHLRFFHMGLEYMILPSIVMDDDKLLKDIVDEIVDAKNLRELKETEGIIEDIFKELGHKTFRGGVLIDIIFLKYNTQNQSVQIFGSIQDLLPSRISTVVSTMKQMKVTDALKYDKELLRECYIYLADYLLPTYQTARVTGSKKGLENAIAQERIELAKLLLGYRKIPRIRLLEAFDHYRNYRYDTKEKKIARRLVQPSNNKAKQKDHNVGVLEWLAYPGRFISREKRLERFFKKIDAIA